MKRRPAAFGYAAPGFAATCLAALALVALATAAASAQVIDRPVPVDSVVVAPEVEPILVPASPDLTPEPISPGGALIRSMVVPGWGQAAFDAHFRGGIYFAGWAANWYMMFRNQVRLDDARFRFDLRVDQLEAALIAASPNPDSMRAALDQNPSIIEAAVIADDGPGSSGNNLRKLVRAREQQREDWIAWSIFWLLASGVDAYVTAHLSDFPADIDVRRNDDRSVSMGVRLPLPGRWP